jgi:hypothetical protein
MSDTELLAVGVVAIITAIGSLALVVLKLIKKSTCLGMSCETRSIHENQPPNIIISQPPSPMTTHRDSPAITHKESNV